MLQVQDAIISKKNVLLNDEIWEMTKYESGVTTLRHFNNKYKKWIVKKFLS
jgi:hypothetical protein